MLVGLSIRIRCPLAAVWIVRPVIVPAVICDASIAPAYTNEAEIWVAPTEPEMSKLPSIAWVMVVQAVPFQNFVWVKLVALYWVTTSFSCRATSALAAVFATVSLHTDWPET